MVEGGVDLSIEERSGREKEKDEVSIYKLGIWRNASLDSVKTICGYQRLHGTYCDWFDELSIP